MDFSDDHMMGGGDNGSWGFDPAAATPSLVNNILNMPDIMMAENPGYVILRRAIPQEFIKKAADDMNTQQPLQTADRFITYHFTSSARELVDEFIRVWQPPLTRLDGTDLWKGTHRQSHGLYYADRSTTEAVSLFRRLPAQGSLSEAEIHDESYLHHFRSHPAEQRNWLVYTT